MNRKAVLPVAVVEAIERPDEQPAVVVACAVERIVVLAMPANVLAAVEAASAAQRTAAGRTRIQVAVNCWYRM